MPSSLFLNLLFHEIAPIVMRYLGVCQGICGPKVEEVALPYVKESFVPLVVRVCDMMEFVPLISLTAFSCLPEY